ncbi:hypothetical protein [Pantoea anthophila]|uniref:hypothetical protein n=1 Tax=Pantoea anthophila TaxID=470931 RepID=UPI002DB95024|nr:hypothetical protein [Pantoea anthophila]MEB5707363.1 hypothetical protein [Pantoea anthophila]MEB6518234.1 hypothetical protein [Pantoea anthophila]
MTIYTQDPGQGINQPIGNAASGLGESLAATFEQGFEEGPFNSALRLNRAYGQLNDTSSAMVPKSQADATLKQYGVKSINIPDEGVTQTYLDNVVSNRKDTLAKQQIAAAAPSGFVATPLNVMANLAGAMADPGNLALALVPFAGEARAATLLGRAGERLLQGAAMGGLQTGATLPTMAMASAAEGDDFTLGSAMENLFYGTVGGGLLHAGGGVIADLVRGRRPTVTSESPLETTARVEPVSEPVSPSRVSAGEPDNASPLLDQTISREADNYAYSRAYDDVIPEYQQSLQNLQQGRIDNVADLRAEMAANEHAASRLDATLKSRTDQYQQQRIKYRDARQRALADIESEKQALSSRNDEINQALEGNAAAEKASWELSAIGRGEIPDGLAGRISDRAGQIKSGLKRTSLAEGVRTAAQRIDDAHWTQRQNAFRAGLSHMMQGKAPDVEPFFDMTAPELREPSIEQIRKGPRSDTEPSTVNASRDAEADYQRASRDDADLLNAQEDFESELALAKSRVDELDSPELREALGEIQKQASDESLFKGYQEYAACMLRRM